MFEEIFKKSQEEKKLINIRLYSDDGDSFWCGYVESFNSETVSFQHYTKYGVYDGIHIEKIENIESIDYDNDYIRAIEYIVKNAISLNQASKKISAKSGTEKDWQYELLVKYAKQEDTIILIEINGDSAINGFIENITKDIVTIIPIEEEGKSDGFSIYKIEDITAIIINGLQGRKRLMLHNWRKSNSEQ